MIGGRMRNFPVNVQINDVAVGGNNFTPVGSFSDGYPLLPILDLTPVMEVPAGAGITTQRSGRVHPRRHLDVQRVGAEGAAAQLHRAGRIRRRTVRTTWSGTRTSTTARSAAATRACRSTSPGSPAGSARRRQVNVVRPLGHVQVRLAAGQRQPPDERTGFALTSAYTYAKATDWWAGGILIPEYWDLNKGTQGGNTPHKVDISVIYELPFGPGEKFANDGGVVSHDRAATGR